MAQSVDILPKCPICGVSFYCIGIQTIKLQCEHLFCQLCLNKLGSGGDYVCCFDNQRVSGHENWGELANYFKQYLDTYRNAQELKRVVEASFKYDRSVLPCSSRKGCVGSCGNIHSDYNWKGKECPLGEQCPNANQCIFRHPNERETLPMQRSPPLPQNNPMQFSQIVVPHSFPAPLETSHYSEVTSPKPVPVYGQMTFDSWRCENCQAMNSNCTACSCGCIRRR